MKDLLIVIVGLVIGLAIGTAGAQGAESANPSDAADSRLAAMQTADDSRGYEGVGRLDIGQNTFCTGSLISETVVLTAAHCLFERGTGRRLDDSSIQFRAGLRSGRAAASRGVRRSVVHSGYDNALADTPEAVATDLALIELDQPIRKSGISPFATQGRVQRGDEVRVVSYAITREDAPSMQEMCHVLGDLDAAQVLSCDIDFGASGAPIFAMPNGVPQIVSVVSAKADMAGTPVALVAPIGDNLIPLLAKLSATDGVFRRVSAPVRQLDRSQDLASRGAKFLRP